MAFCSAFFTLSGNSYSYYSGYLYTYSLRSTKTEIVEEDGTGFIDKFKKLPLYSYRKKARHSNAEIKKACIAEFGQEKWDANVPTDQNLWAKRIENPDTDIADEELRTFIKAKIVEQEAEGDTAHWKKNNKYFGPMADDPEMVAEFPEMADYQTNSAGESVLRGIDIVGYVGVLHGVIKDLISKVETLETKVAALEAV